MQYRSLHSWDVTPEAAREIQNRLRREVIAADRFGTINTVAGVDIGLKKDIALASVVVLSFPELQVVDSEVAAVRCSFSLYTGVVVLSGDSSTPDSI